MLNKHLFAIYIKAQLPALIGQKYQLQDADLWLRVTKILRLREGAEFILFNGSAQATLTLDHGTFLSKNIVHARVVEVSTSKSLHPAITLLQGIPRKAVFEEIIYNAAQLGVATIVPVKTEKAHTLDFSTKEMIRFSNIMIAACEQAKQFIVPVIAAPITLPAALASASSRSRLEGRDDKTANIVFDSTGVSCETHLPEMKLAQHISVLFGPEGGLTDQELIMVEQANFIKSRLTPTILRSEDAPLVGIGLLRSLIPLH